MEQLANPAGAGRFGPRQFTQAEFNAGNVVLGVVGTVFILVFAAGVVLFYSGLAPETLPRRLLTNGLFLVAPLSMVWVLWSYSLSFAPNWGSEQIPTAAATERSGSPVIGGTRYMALGGLGSQVAADKHEHAIRRFNDQWPHTLFAMFQLGVFFAAAGPLLVVLHRRLGPVALLTFLVVWGTILYAPLAHWTWGFGWLRQRGMWDYAGASLLHIVPGFSVLACAVIWRVSPADSTAPVAIPAGWAGLGSALAWLASLAFCAACQQRAGGGAGLALMNAHLAASAGAIGWAARDWLRGGELNWFDAGAGGLAGLAAIAAGCGYVPPQSALVIGLLGGLVARFLSVRLGRARPGEPAFQVFAIQGVAGVLGLLLAAVFANPSVAFDHQGNALTGLLAGNHKPLIWQALAAAAVAGYAFLVALLMSLVWAAIGSRRSDA